MEQASALHRVLDRQLEAIQYIEKREAQDIPPEVKREKEAIARFLPALEGAMQLADTN